MQEPIAHAPDAATVRRDVVLVGASAGGVEALMTLARGLPADAPVAIAVVLHLPMGANSRLATILERAGPLPARVAEHGQPLERGTIVVAPSDRHLVVSTDRVFLLDGPRENGFRPAIDPLFRSAARTLGPRAIGVVLSGTLDDGAAGLAAIKAFGGGAIVQEPGDALASGMPQAAIDAAEPDHVVPAAAIGRVIAEMASTPIVVEDHVVDAARAADPHLRAHALARDPSLIADPMELVPHGVDLACPECGGALQEILVGSMSRFRCRTGHVYSPLTLVESKSTELEAALWAALRSLEEEASVAGRLAVRSRELGAPSAASRFEIRQGEAAQRGDLIRQAIASIGSMSDDDPEETPTSDEPGVVRAG